jgi:hypothetical protein
MIFTACLASREEKQRAMPADPLVPEPMGVVTHAITINASPERVASTDGRRPRRLVQLRLDRQWRSSQRQRHPARVAACRSG